MWQDDTARVLWKDQWDKGDENALNILTVHCPKCPARFVNNIHVRDSISRTLKKPCSSVLKAGMAGRVGGAVLICNHLKKMKNSMYVRI